MAHSRRLSSANCHSLLSQLAREIVEEKLKKCYHAFKIHNKLPEFNFSEVQISRDLGQGQFGTVSELRSLYL